MSDTQSQLREARMSLAQAVTRSLDAAVPSDPDARAVDEHRHAAELRLRRAGCEDLGFQIDHDLDATSAACRRNCRQLMQLIDAQCEPAIGGFERAADGGGRR